GHAVAVGVVQLRRIFAAVDDDGGAAGRVRAQAGFDEVGDAVAVGILRAGVDGADAARVDVGRGVVGLAEGRARGAGRVRLDEVVDAVAVAVTLREVGLLVVREAAAAGQLEGVGEL